MTDAMMNTHGLVFLKHTMGTKLGQPDVEEVMALCLTGSGGRWREREKEKMTVQESRKENEGKTRV